MYHVSTQGVDECMINVQYYYYNDSTRVGRHCSPVVLPHQPGQHEGDVFTVSLGGAEEQTGVVGHNLQHQGQEMLRVHLTIFITVLHVQTSMHDQNDYNRKSQLRLCSQPCKSMSQFHFCVRGSMPVKRTVLFSEVILI